MIFVCVHCALLLEQFCCDTQPRPVTSASAQLLMQQVAIAFVQDDYTPGDLGFDPLGLYPTVSAATRSSVTQ